MFAAGLKVYYVSSILGMANLLYVGISAKYLFFLKTDLELGFTAGSSSWVIYLVVLLVKPDFLTFL